MSDYETYRKELKEAENFFEKRISDTQAKAYDYGILVVRNSVLISGGGLLAIPAIVGLSENIKINVGEIIIAGFSFAGGVFLSLVASYLIHSNWNLHAQAWKKHWDDRRELLEKVYLADVPYEQIDSGSKEHFWSIHNMVVCATSHAREFLSCFCWLRVFAFVLGSRRKLMR